MCLMFIEDTSLEFRYHIKSLETVDLKVFEGYIFGILLNDTVHKSITNSLKKILSQRDFTTAS